MTGDTCLCLDMALMFHSEHQVDCTETPLEVSVREIQTRLTKVGRPTCSVVAPTHRLGDWME